MWSEVNKKRELMQNLGILDFGIFISGIFDNILYTFFYKKPTLGAEAHYSLILVNFSPIFFSIFSKLLTKLSLKFS